MFIDLCLCSFKCDQTFFFVAINGLKICFCFLDGGYGVKKTFVSKFQDHEFVCDDNRKQNKINDDDSEQTG